MHSWASAEIFPAGGNVEILLVIFSLLTRQWNWTFTKLFRLPCIYPISLCCLNLNPQSFAWNVFYNSAIWNAFSFHKLPNIRFFEHFLQISHNLRIINSQNNMTGEETRNLTLFQNCFKQWQVERNVDKTIRQITKVRTPRRLKTLSRWITKTLHSKIIALQVALVLTKKSELNLNAGAQPGFF